MVQCNRLKKKIFLGQYILLFNVYSCTFLDHTIILTAWSYIRGAFPKFEQNTGVNNAKMLLSVDWARFRAMLYFSSCSLGGNREDGFGNSPEKLLLRLITEGALCFLGE